MLIVGSGSNGSDAEILLDEDSLIDLTEKVTDDKLEWTAPSDHDEYVVFAFYERYTNQRSCKGVPIDVIANGSWVTDHFSAGGSKLVTEFWEDNLLDDEVQGLLKSVGKHCKPYSSQNTPLQWRTDHAIAWEDSMEIQASLYWTPDFLERFKSARNYDLTPYLPLMFHKANAFHGYEHPYDLVYALDTEDQGRSKYHQDYRLTLNEGLMEYLKSLDDWAATLGVTHSAQVAYNQPVDVVQSLNFLVECFMLTANLT